MLPAMVHRSSVLLIALAALPTAAATVEAALEQPAQLSKGDTLTLKGARFTVRYDGTFSKTPCAGPNNCGAGYMPRAQFTVVDCGGKDEGSCPYAASHTGNTSDYQTIMVAIVARPATATASLASCKKLAGETERDACLASLSQRPDEKDGAICSAMTVSRIDARDECFGRLAARRSDDTLCLEIKTPDKRNRCLANALFKMRDVRLCEGVLETGVPFELHNMRTRGGCISSVIDVARKGTVTSPDVCTALKEVSTREFCLAFTMTPAGDQKVCTAISASNALARSHCFSRLFQGKPATEAQCRLISDVLLYRQCCTLVSGGCASPNP